MNTDSTKSEIVERLIKVYREYANVRRIDLDSQMCNFWEDPTVEILVDSDELNAIEMEFGIEFDDDSAMDIYDCNLGEAAEFIEKMIKIQNKSDYISDTFIKKLSASTAKKIIHEIWHDSVRGRKYIVDALEKIKYLNKI